MHRVRYFLDRRPRRSWLAALIVGSLYLLAACDSLGGAGSEPGGDAAPGVGIDVGAGDGVGVDVGVEAPGIDALVPGSIDVSGFEPGPAGPVVLVSGAIAPDRAQSFRYQLSFTLGAPRTQQTSAHFSLSGFRPAVVRR